MKAGCFLNVFLVSGKKIVKKYELMTYSEIYNYCKKMGYPKDELKEAMAEIKAMFEEVLEFDVTKNADGTITLKPSDSEEGDASVVTWTPVEA